MPSRPCVPSDTLLANERVDASPEEIASRVTVEIAQAINLTEGRASILQVLLVTRHSAVFEQDGVSVPVEPGEGLVLNPRSGGVQCTNGADQEVFLLRAPRANLVAALGPDHEIGPVVLRRDLPVTRLLFNYSKAYLESATGKADPNLDRLFGAHILHLLALALGRQGEGLEPMEGGGPKATRLQAVLEEIAKGACEESFSAETVAQKLGVTDRYVRALLEETGKTFSEHRLEHRLRRAFQLLDDPAFAHRSVTEIALMAGFGDISHFNRSFRRRFGNTPTGVRSGKKSKALGREQP